MEHREIAVKCFNSTWDLIDKKDRTEEEVLQMIHMAHASRYHWGEIGTPVNFTRGEWQISRVYALAGMGESALYHAKHALKFCVDHNIGDFDLAFAYESLARAYSILGLQTEKEVEIARAKEAAEQIAKKEDKDYFLSELASI